VRLFPIAQKEKHTQLEWQNNISPGGDILIVPLIPEYYFAQGCYPCTTFHAYPLFCRSSDRDFFKLYVTAKEESEVG